MQLKPRLSKRPDMTGEFDITDYALGFDQHGPLCHLNLHWDAIVHFCKTVDTAQDDAKRQLARALSNTPSDDAETLFMLNDELEHATLAEQTLVKATIFIVLCSFKEFALKEIYGQLKNQRPLSAKRAYSQIKAVFVENEIWPTDSDSHERLSKKSYEWIRNNFAHGDWGALKDEMPKLELHGEFLEVIGFLYEIRERLCSKGIHL